MSDQDCDELATRRLMDTTYLGKNRFKFVADKNNPIYKCLTNDRFYQVVGKNDFIEVEISGGVVLGEVIKQNGIWIKCKLQRKNNPLSDKQVNDIINQICVLDHDKERLKYLISKRFDKKN